MVIKKDKFNLNRIGIEEKGLDTLPKIFRNRVSKYGDRIALRYKKYGIWQEVSWQEYFETVRMCAFGLISLGLQKDDTINILSEDRPEWLYADLATISISGISVGIYPTSASFSCEYIVNHSGAKIWLVEDEEQLDKALEVKDKLPNLEKIIIFDTRNVLKWLNDPMIISFEEVLKRGEKLINENNLDFNKMIDETECDSVAIMVYTSGTTGPPKGAMISHRNILAGINTLKQVNPMNELDEVLCYLPLCHAAERVFSFFNAIIHGYTVNFAESIDTIEANLMEVSPTMLFCPPRIWEKFHSKISYEIQEVPWFKRVSYFWGINIGKRFSALHLQGRKIPFLLRLQHNIAELLLYRKLKDIMGLKKARNILTGAAPISPEILLYFRSINCPIREAYGQTESCAGGTIHFPGRVKIGTVGQVMPACELKIADDGEILIRAESVFCGYYKDPELTKETIIDGWLYTGDIGELDEDGFLKILDRKKDIIITAGGKNITPQYIENLLKFSPYIEDAVVIGDKHKYLVALIMIDEDNCTKYAQRERIPFSTYADLSQNPNIKELVDKEIKQVNKKLSRVEQVKKFATFNKKLKEEDGEVTPTMKIKRRNIADMYSDVIDSLYK
ncbi:AMP-dependent synthetase/ligase [Thermodesulfobacteriota bacterium]